MTKNGSGFGLIARIRGAFGRVTLSANDGAMIFAYETLGDLLAKRFKGYSRQSLAAASAGIINPEAEDVFAHLSADAKRPEIEAAAKLLQAALHQVTAEYLKPEESGANWRLKMDCAVVVDGKKSQAALTRPLDWSELPDVVRASYMSEERESYVLSLIPVERGRRVIDPFSVALMAAVGLAAAGLVLIFWQNIMEAVRNIVLPFFQKIDPRLEKLVANAFIWIDKNLAVPLRSKVIRAWRTLRRRVKAVLASYRYEGNSKWIRKILAWAHRDDGSIAQLVQEQTVDYEDVPEAVRAAHMKGEFSGWSEETDITALRDKEIALLEELSD